MPQCSFAGISHLIMGHPIGADFRVLNRSSFATIDKACDRSSSKSCVSMWTNDNLSPDWLTPGWRTISDANRSPDSSSGELKIKFRPALAAALPSGIKEKRKKEMRFWGERNLFEHHALLATLIPQPNFVRYSTSTCDSCDLLWAGGRMNVWWNIWNTS